MESYRIENLTFTYPDRTTPALDDVSFSVFKGEFVTVCGKSGCGKTTLLRLLKPALSPFGNISGNIFFNSKELSSLSLREQASKIGFVMQNPDNQIATDKVWHELAFGLESLGCHNSEIRAKVAEIAEFFGIQTWFHKKVSELSGGQKQLLNLASIMVMQPSVLILDEPTSQLDPIAAQEFLNILEKINRELGTTVILTEHRLDEAFPISDRVIVIDAGKIITEGAPKEVGAKLFASEHEMYDALPAPMRIYHAIENGTNCPVTVREGRKWLEDFSSKNELHPELIPKPTESPSNTLIELRDIHFRYERNLPDVIKGLSLTVNNGELFAIVGGNGTGKTTALSLICGLLSPQRGKIVFSEKKRMAMLPQNPQLLFVKNTVFDDLEEMLSSVSEKSEKEARVYQVAALCRIDKLLNSHPHDLSGGEQQRAALAKVLLTTPEILLLDEPTKGMDAHFKKIFADILNKLKNSGVTIVMVSHDIEFCAEYADRCAMFFDGAATSFGTPREFFSGKSFYTTSANRMARSNLPAAVLAEDVILACGGTMPERNTPSKTEIALPMQNIPKGNNPKKKLPLKRKILGAVFAFAFVLTCILTSDKFSGWKNYMFQLITIAELAGALACFLPKKEGQKNTASHSSACKKIPKRSIAVLIFTMLLAALTIYIGVFHLDNKKYYFISLMLVLETLLPFFVMFEHRKPQARELVLISVLCAMGVAGRAAFFMLPQFKPVCALVILSGACFGCETGFLAGALTAFISNFFFGQGPLTPWQMFAFGIIGLISGLVIKSGLLKKTKLSLSIFGAIMTFFIYGGIMNPASVIMWQPNLNFKILLSSFVLALPFDLIHAAATVFFLWFSAEPVIEKFERIKIKYGMFR